LGDTPFTQELRQSEPLQNKLKQVKENLRKYAANGDAELLEEKFSRSFSSFNSARGASDLYDMFINLQAKRKFNVADVFLGSFNGRFKISDVNTTAKTAKVTFTITNNTGWLSASKIPGGHWANDDEGALYKETITWTQAISW